LARKEMGFKGNRYRTSTQRRQKRQGFIGTRGTKTTPQRKTWNIPGRPSRSQKKRNMRPYETCGKKNQQEGGRRGLAGWSREPQAV